MLDEKLLKAMKITAVLASFAALLAALILFLYLKVLPWIVSNEKVLDFVKDFAKEKSGVELIVQKPVLKTSLSPEIEMRAGEISISKDKKEIFSIKNAELILSFAKIFDKTIILKKAGTDYIFADVNGLESLAPKQEKEAQKSDFTVEWINGLFYLKKCHIVYKYQDISADVLAGNILISDKREPKKVKLSMLANIKKGKENVRISFTDKDRICIKDKKLIFDNALLTVNRSKIYLDAVSDQKNNFDLTVKARDFDVKSAVNLLNSNLVIPNGSDMLAFFKDISGTFNFYVNLTNDGMNGRIDLNKIFLKVTPLNDIPVNLANGNIKITTNEIFLNDFKGWYGKSKANHIEAFGSIKDYMKTCDTYLEATGNTTKEFTTAYLSKAVGYPLELTGDAPAKMIIKSINNKIDISWMTKIEKGKDILIGGASISPVSYDRALKADLYLDGVDLDIKSINYYIAKDINKGSKIKPILTVKGKMEVAEVPVIKNLGFEIPNPLPSEFLNVLIGQKMFKKGKISGNLQFVNTGKVPVLDGDLRAEGVRIPSQRLSIKKGSFVAKGNSLTMNAEGKFKRSDYKFDGTIKNEMVFPIVVKDINLTVDNVDIDRILNSFNKQNTDAVTAPPVKSEMLVTAVDEENDDAYTFDTGLLIVEKGSLKVLKGFYKEIEFGNLDAKMSLDKNGVFQVNSNKFDFAQGHSSCKVHCDLKNHKYSVKLGVKDINSDLIATTLLALKKEISGKASGILELNTDDSLKLNGSMKFIIKNGTIGKVGLVEYVLKFAALFRNPMAMISPSAIVDMVNVPEGNFDKITGDLAIKDNVVEKIMIKSSAPQLSSFIIGRFDLESRDATLRIYTKFSSRNKGFAGFLRNISLNSLANRVPLSSRNDSNYYAAELAQLPPLEADEKDCQVFLTKVDGDVEHFNFISSLKKIK